jgi:hypothetical protein
MKSTKLLFLALLTVGGWLACDSSRAQPSSPTPPGLSTNAPAPRAPRATMLNRMAVYLNLTDSQKTRVGPILDDQRVKLSAVFQDSSLSVDDKRAKVKAIHDAINEQLKPILTPDQFQKWIAMQGRVNRMAPPPMPAGTNAPMAPPRQ